MRSRRPALRASASRARIMAVSRGARVASVATGKVAASIAASSASPARARAPSAATPRAMTEGRNLKRGAGSGRGAGAQHHDRHVVALGRGTAEALDLGQNVRDDLGRRASAVALPECGEAVLAELLAADVHGLGDAVAVEQERVAEGELDLALLILRVLEQAERQAALAQLLDRAVVAPHQ